jgi:hypothetical protein
MTTTKACRCLSNERETLRRKRGDLNREVSAIRNADLRGRFVDAAKAMLPRETFDAILEASGSLNAAKRSAAVK